MIRNLGAYPAQLLKPTILKFCYSPQMVITFQNLKILLFLLLFSRPANSKFYHLATCSFFGLVIQANFLEISRNYVLIIIVIISSITVLVSENVICFAYFMSMSHGINKNAPTIVAPLLLPTTLSPGLFVLLEETLYQPFFALM